MYTGRDLINDLRHEERLRKHFKMGTWFSSIDKRRCGTVGCIAGTILLRNGRTAGQYFRADDVARTIEADAAEILEIPRAVAQHLFLPHSWTIDLVCEGFHRHYEHLWHEKDNYRCDLTTIESMKKWALKCDTHWDHNITPDGAADVLEGILDRHPGWVDWSEMEKIDV